MSDPILVNGTQHSWGSIRFRADDEIYYGFTSISYGDSRERVKGYGMGRSQAPRARSLGKYAPDVVKVAGWKGSVQALLEALAAKSADGLSYGDVSFEIVVQFVEAGDLSVVVEIFDCVVTKVNDTHEEGADPLKTELEIDCMSILRNGLSLASAS